MYNQFKTLNFQPHHISNAVIAKHTFENGWGISVVSGPAGSGLYGNIAEYTYEVAIVRPNGNLTEDVSGWNSEQEVSAMMWVLSQI